MRVGVLALQGAVEEHIRALSLLGVEGIEVRLPIDLKDIDALIIPGGESTTISKMLSVFKLKGTLQDRINNGFPVFGTCAGMILLARDVRDSKVEGLGVLDISVKRNAYGRQINSFETDLNIPVLGKDSFHGVFIRAPLVESVKPGVEVICLLDGHAVAIKQGKLLACSFHPELTDDLRFHRYFLDLV